MNILKKFNTRKFRMSVIKMAITACTIAMAICNTAMLAFAVTEDNKAPDGAETNTFKTLITIVMWIVRIVIIAIGGLPGIVKIIQGQADENPRDRNAGIATLIVTGVCFAATFLINALIL